MLEGLENSDSQTQPSIISSESLSVGIGLDSCVIPLKQNSMHLVQTTDFFYPLIDDPYTMGRIACCNVLSDLYAMGVVTCDNILMLLGVSTEMTISERDTVMPLMLQGFKECADEAETSIRGGQTVKNPWIIIGGVATSVCSLNEIIQPTGAQAGDVLILTKPLGTQVAVNAHQWMEQDDWTESKFDVSDEQIDKLFEKATVQMATLNKTAAEMMHKHKAKACTDVTGFGLLGHAQNLVEVQADSVSFHFDRLPILANAVTIERKANHKFKLLEGKSAETSGGLLMALSPSDAEAFCNEFEGRTGQKCWIIGRVVTAHDRSVILPDNCEIIEV